MIEIKGLSYSFGPKLVLNDINLTVPDGTVLGIVGINGAGKSTLLRLLSGVYECKENGGFGHGGKIFYDGIEPTDPDARQNIFFLPDDPYYTSASTPNKMFEFYKVFYPEIDRSVFDRLISEYRLNPKQNIRNFSKGMRRQMFIALALAIKPKYMLLDEAFDGLDPLSRKIFKDAIISMVEENGTTVVITSHSLRELEDFCDKFALIDNNVIKSQGDISDNVARLCKFTLAFTEEVNAVLFGNLPVVSLDIKGRFVTIVLEGESEAVKEQLAALSPVVMDEMPLDFEEFFIHDVLSGRGVK